MSDENMIYRERVGNLPALFLFKLTTIHFIILTIVNKLVIIRV